MPIRGVVIHSFLYFNILHGNVLLTLRLFISCLHCTQPCIPLLGWLGSLCFWISFQVVLENTEGTIHRCVEEKVERCRYQLLIFKHGTRYIGHWPNNYNYKTYSPFTWNDFISYFDLTYLKHVKIIRPYQCKDIFLNIWRKQYGCIILFHLDRCNIFWYLQWYIEIFLYKSKYTL